MPKPPQYPVRSIVLFLSKYNSPPDGLQTSVKLAHLSACPSIPPASLSAPPTVLPLSRSCSRSDAPVCSHAGRLPQRGFRYDCCASSVRQSERRWSDFKRATDIVLVEEGKLIYWPRTGEQFADAAYAMARVQATLA